MKNLKWYVEDIGVHANILQGDPDNPNIDEDTPVGLGMPLKFAQNIVNKHNEVLDKLLDKKENK